jgi:hypothetical protein
MILNQKNVHILSSQQPPYRVGVGAKVESSGVGEGADYRLSALKSAHLSAPRPRIQFGAVLPDLEFCQYLHMDDFVSVRTQVFVVRVHFSRLPMTQCGDPNGIRTRVTAVKGRCPRPLDDRVRKAGPISEAGPCVASYLPVCFRRWRATISNPARAGQSARWRRCGGRARPARWRPNARPLRDRAGARRFVAGANLDRAPAQQLCSR